MTRSVKVFLGLTTVLVALIGVIALSSLALYYVVSIRNANELVIEASRAVTAGDYDVAIAKYSAALRKPLSNQQKTFVYTNRGHAYNSKRQFVEAIADHTEAIRLNPQLSYAFAARGYAYVERGELDKALVDLTESIRLDPNSDSAYYNRGLLLNRRGQFSDALMDFDEAARCSPDRADRLVARALCYLAMDDFDRALASFDGAIATEPGNAIGYLARSNFYARRGNADKQQRDYQQALRLNPNSGNLWTEVDKWFPDGAKISTERKQNFQFDVLGLLSPTVGDLSPQRFLSRNAGKTYHQLFEEAKVAHAQGNYEDEIALWNDVAAMNLSAIQIAPAIMNRGSAYSAGGDLYRALQDYNQAIELNPKNAGAYVNRASALARIGDFKSAMKDYAEAITLNPQQWEAYFNRATELRELGKIDEALADLNAVTRLNPKFAGAYVNRAAIRIHQGQLTEAMKDCNMALQLDPNIVQAYINRASVFAHKRNYAGVLSDLQTAVHLKPDNSQSGLNSLAWLRATCPEGKMRDGKQAVELATKACELSNWKDWHVIDTLAAAYAEAGDFDQAIKYQNQVLQMTKPSANHAKLEQRLTFYKGHKPYREQPD